MYDDVERFSVLRSTMAVERSDVCLILIDGQEGVTEQDTRRSQALPMRRARRPSSWSTNGIAVESKDDRHHAATWSEGIRQGFMPSCLYAPVLFLSALTGQRVDRLFEVIQDVRAHEMSRMPHHDRRAEQRPGGRHRPGAAAYG